MSVALTKAEKSLETAGPHGKMTAQRPNAGPFHPRPKVSFGFFSLSLAEDDIDGIGSP
jgi:hypothetical protein